MHFCWCSCVSAGIGGAACWTEEVASVSSEQRRRDSDPAGLTQQYQVLSDHFRSNSTCLNPIIMAGSASAVQPNLVHLKLCLRGDQKRWGRGGSGSDWSSKLNCSFSKKLWSRTTASRYCVVSWSCGKSQDLLMTVVFLLFFRFLPELLVWLQLGHCLKETPGWTNPLWGLFMTASDRQLNTGPLRFLVAPKFLLTHFISFVLSCLRTSYFWQYFITEFRLS